MKNFKFTINGNVYEVGIDAPENGKANVNVNGKSYVVEVEADVMQATAVRRPIAAPAAAAPSKSVSGVMKSPLPGKVLKVVVAEGQVVKRGDTLMVIESMKMENNIAAQNDGVVRAIMVSAEQSILQGDPLLEFEAVGQEEAPAPAPAPAPKAAPKAAPAAPKASGAAGSIKVEAGAAGKVFKIEAPAGTAVKTGDAIIILEAMKMEIPVVAPQDGTVASINVAVGDAIENGDVLATMN